MRVGEWKCDVRSGLSKKELEDECVARGAIQSSSVMSHDSNDCGFSVLDIKGGAMQKTVLEARLTRLTS